LKIVVIDDEEFFRNAWHELLGDQIEVLSYEDPSVLASDVLSGSLQLAQIDIVISDFYFKRNDLASMKLPSFLKNHGYFGKVWLATSAKDIEVPEGVSGKITKEPCDLDTLKNLI
jgi:hypothetical protein